MKNLVIVESPSKSKTIEKYLGNNFEVVSSKGHIRDLAIKGKDGLGVDVENGFKTTYKINDDKKDLVKELKEKVKKSDEVYLATDPDREGEAISWHLAEELGLDISKENRVVFHEITKGAVLDAFNQPRKIDMDLVASQETRRVLDRIIGFKLSTLLKSKIKSKSAGRVQSVALKLIVDREKEIKAFIPEEYWTIEAKFDENNKKFTASLSKIKGKKAKLVNQEQAQKVVDDCKGLFVCTSAKSQVRKKEPKLPFITSSLQQEASNKLNFSAKKTMQIAQKLYEGIELEDHAEGLITYMRTDSTRLSDVFVNACKEMIEVKYGKNYLGNYKVKNDDSSQDAHEAIRPTNIENDPESIKKYLTNEQYKLYKFIYERAVASLMAPAKSNTVTLTLTQNEYDFVANGSQLGFDGYLRVYGDYEQTKDVMLPKIEEGNNLKAQIIEPLQHFTEPPLRYNEARLIKEMEELGIGRPSTYAMILDTIQSRGYVTYQKQSETSKSKVFIPSEQGILTTEKLDEFFKEIINIKYTADMENELDDIAEGHRVSKESLQQFYDKFKPLVDFAYQNMEKKEAEKVGESCPECGNELVYREGRFGKFISCSAYPTCRYTRKIEQEKKEEPVLLSETCPECGSPLIKRKSRYGNYFVGCSAFPKCRYIQKDENAAPKTYKRKKKGKE